MDPSNKANRRLRTADLKLSVRWKSSTCKCAVAFSLQLSMQIGRPTLLQVCTRRCAMGSARFFFFWQLKRRKPKSDWTYIVLYIFPVSLSKNIGGHARNRHTRLMIWEGQGGEGGGQIQEKCSRQTREEVKGSKTAHHFGGQSKSKLETYDYQLIKVLIQTRPKLRAISQLW